MKIITLLFTTLLYFNSNAQSYDNFDTISSDQIYYDTLNPDNHIWQIGQTNKPFFDNEWAVATDTTNMYYSLTDATLNLTLTREQKSNGFVLEFNHKIDTDLHHAGGYIEFNIDNDSTQYYVNENGTNHIYSSLNYIIDFTNGWLHTDLGHLIHPYEFIDYEIGMENITEIQNSNIDKLTHVDTLRQHIKTFTGVYDSWEHVKLNLLLTYGLKTQDVPDTLNLKFHFISDSLTNNKNGWAIKNIHSGEVFFGSLNENEIHSQLSGYPTPTVSNYTVEIVNKQNEPITVDILTLNGKHIKSISKTGERIELDLSDLVTGQYILKYYLSDVYKGF